MKIKIIALSSLLFFTAFTSCTSYLTPAVLGNNISQSQWVQTQK